MRAYPFGRGKRVLVPADMNCKEEEEMMVHRAVMLVVTVLAVAGLSVMSGCSTTSSNPSSPSTDPGTVYGYVTHALTATPIENATVVVDGESTTTDASGYYIVEGVDPGTVTVEASLTDYVTLQEEVQVGEGESVRQDCVLLPSTAGNEYRIVLTWGENPSDLDSHLWVPVDGETHTHVYYSNRGSTTTEPYAALDVDDVSGYGPETITVLPEHEGQYTYAVYHFSGTGTLQSSQATVRIYQGNTLRYTLTAPDETCGEHWWWYVCSFNAQSGSFTIANSLEAYAPTVTGEMVK
jgi:hypothetical protein